jgi:hypothetical protein
MLSPSTNRQHMGKNNRPPTIFKHAHVENTKYRYPNTDNHHFKFGLEPLL